MRSSSVISFLSRVVFLIVLGLTIFSFIFPFHSRFDFTIYMLAARAVLHHATLYPIPYHNTTFTYPTSVLPFLAPFSYLPPAIAASLWNSLSLICVFLSVWLLLKIGRIQISSQYVFVLLSLILILPPVRSTLQYGQINAFVLFFILLAFFISQKRSSSFWLVGILLGIATALKTFPLFLLFYFIAKRQWKVAVVTCCVFLLFLVAGTFGHWQYITDYVQYAHRLVANRRILTGDQSFPMIILLYLPFLRSLLTEITVSVYIVFVGISFFFWKKSKKTMLSDFVFYSELLAVTILIIMPYAWIHHLLFFIPLVWSMLLRLINMRISKRSIILFALFATLFFVDFSFLNDFMVSFWLEPQVLSFHAFLGLILLFLGKFLTRRKLFALVQTP